MILCNLTHDIVDKMLAHRRKNLVLSSVIKIQYHVRKWLKRIRRRNVSKTIKLKQGKKSKQKSMKRKLIKAKSKKFKIVNRGGKVMRINILEEQRQKEEQKRMFDELAHHQNINFNDVNVPTTLIDLKARIQSGSKDAYGFHTPQTVKNIHQIGMDYQEY